MKLSDFSIKKIWSHPRNSHRAEFRTISTKAHHDWKFILFSFLCLSIAVIVCNMLLFFKISSGELFTSSTPTNTKDEVVSKKGLEDTVKFFADRQRHLQELKVVKPNIPDPSL